MTEPERYPLELELPSALKRALELLQGTGASCYVVGGSIRDALLGLTPKDFDVEVYGVGLEKIADTLSQIGKTDLVGRSYAVVKLWIKGEEYDFAIPRRERKTGLGHQAFDVEADPNMEAREAIQRRDFTVNALLYDYKERQVIDYCGGKQDLEKRILRHVSDSFDEDPLRALRAMQFAGRFQMELHADTAALCHKMGPEYWSLPKERIWGEWNKWATQSRSLSSGMRALESSRWIRFYPELNTLRGLPQDPEWHPEGDVWTHTLCCLDALHERTDWGSLEESERRVIVFAVLCHDLGKARCTRWGMKRGAKHWISPGHDAQSVWLTHSFLHAMRAPLKIIDKVANLAGAHHFLNTGSDSIPSDSALRRLARRLAPASSNQLVYVMLADHYGRPPHRSEQQEKRIADFARRIQQLELEEEAPKPFVQGRHLIARGLQPGPDFKPILDAAYEAQMDGAFSTGEEAQVWLDQYLAKQG